MRLTQSFIRNGDPYGWPSTRRTATTHALPVHVRFYKGSLVSVPHLVFQVGFTKKSIWTKFIQMNTEKLVFFFQWNLTIIFTFVFVEGKEVGIPSKIRSWAHFLVLLHWNARKLVFSLACVCLPLCQSVCRSCLNVRQVYQLISYEQVDQFSWKFRYVLQLASSREPALKNLEKKVIFIILWTFISQKPNKDYKKK